MSTKKVSAKKPEYKATNVRFTPEYAAGMPGTKEVVKQPSIAERFQQLDFDEAVFCFLEIKTVMKQRVTDKFKETDERLAMLKNFSAGHNI